MKGVNFPEANKILKAPPGSEDEVYDLPVCETFDSEGNAMVVSVWEFTDEDIERIIKSRRIMFDCWGKTHPPIRLSTQNIFSGGEL